MKTVKKIIKKLTGVALADSRNKTVKILISRLKIHPIYKKRQYFRRTFLVHTDMEIKKDQKVTFAPTRPISRRKSWKVVQ